MSRPSDEFDETELREEFDWMYEFNSRMAKRITNDPDVHNLADYVHGLEDENARLRSCLSDDAENAKAITGENKALRELMKDALIHLSAWMGYGRPEWMVEKARELGVEVD